MAGSRAFSVTLQFFPFEFVLFFQKALGFFFLQMLQKTFKSKGKWGEEINGHARQMKF